MLNLFIVVLPEVIYWAFLTKDKLLDNNLISLPFKVYICQEVQLLWLNSSGSAGCSHSANFCPRVTSGQLSRVTPKPHVPGLFKLYATVFWVSMAVSKVMWLV